ncbi:MAG TPA: hypothetical protein VEI04_10965, partial [Syntrophobacteria bacterium]|nr:hypothetical protein [Syntrophobacteria bacterium]
EFTNPIGGSLDYKGFVTSVGGTVNVQPVVIGADFYYASGDSLNHSGNDVKDYVTPGRDGRYTNMMDDVVFPGMFDDDGASVSGDLPLRSNVTNIRGTGLTSSNVNYTPVNIWAVGAHVDFKPLDQTLLQLGGAYLQFVEDVASKTSTGLPVTASGAAGSATAAGGAAAGGNTTLPAGTVLQKDNKLGTSVYIRLTQGIVDGLQLKAAFGYLFADKGFTPNTNDDNAYKFAAGLFWSW